MNLMTTPVYFRESHYRKLLTLSMLSIILGFITAACVETSPAVYTTPSGTTPASATAEDTPSLSSSPTVNPASTLEVDTPPVPSVRPNIIQPNNAGQVVELAKLGKGTVLSEPLNAAMGMPIYAPDGQWMAIPTSAGIYIYNPETLEERHMIPVGMSFISSPDGELIAAGGLGTVSIWDPIAGGQLGELPGDADTYYGPLAFSPDGSRLAIYGWDREITVWSLEDNQKLFTFPGDRLSFSPDGELAVVVTLGENKVYLYETRGGSEVNKWDARMAGFSPSGQLWLEEAESVRLVYIDRDLVTAPFRGSLPSFSMDGSLMSLFADDQISLYDHGTGQRTQILEGYYPQIDGVLFSPDGKTIAGDVYSLHCPTCTEMDGLDGYHVLWRAADGSIITKIEQVDRSGWLGYSPDGSRLAALQMEMVQIIDTDDGSIVDQIDGFTAPIEGMALSPDGKTMVTAYALEPYTLRFWNLEEDAMAGKLRDQPGGAALSNVEIAFSPDEKYLAVGGDLWDLSAGKQLIDVEQAIGEKTSCWPSHVVFSPQDNTLVTGCFDGQLDVWQVPGGALIKSINGYSSWVNEVVYSPDGERLAAIYNVPDYLVQIWEMPEGTPIYKLTGGHFTRVSYSPDGILLATVLANEEYDQYGWPAGFVQLWSAADGKELSRLEVEDVVSIAFSPDSKILATGSLDGTLRLWEIAGGSLLLETKEHFEQIQRLVFTPDGTNLLTSSQDGTSFRWGIPTETPPN